MNTPFVTCKLPWPLIEVRRFLNSDPPKLVEIWNSQPLGAQLAQPMTVGSMETYVFAKPYFRPETCLVAVDQGQIVGFAHVALARDLNHQIESAAYAYLSLTLVAGHADYAAVTSALLDQAESMAKEAGAAQLITGGAPPLGPFYFGLAGGSHNLGVPSTFEVLRQQLDQRDYQVVGEYLAMRSNIHGFRPAVSREMMQIRRSFSVEANFSPPPLDWLNSCIYMHFERSQFDLIPKLNSAVAASATFIDLPHYSQLWGVHAAALVTVEALEDGDQAKANYLLGEALRQLAETGVGRIETQVDKEDLAAYAMLRTLGFDEVYQSTRMAKKF
ncbi:hypothetical protein [Blastopirellula marina]|uniref:N-acetyltransferase domain-containing protein n=1 Tax=Blastopirellula marina DSM 3645 TaxID=314230 RepID=A4A2B2_9BACT|nr:hypothetical protein [Blastopirellula marina]EAQ77078.1 hypothetical protein DSM3645_25629 [Blastopirellula marina DSM 3645]